MSMLTSFFLAVALVAAAMVADAGKTKPEAASSAESNREELTKARAKNLQPVPAAKADYVFGADQLKPGWEGMKGLKMLKDYFGPGLDAVEFSLAGKPVSKVGQIVYWKLNGVKPGKYYPRLWLETGCQRVKRQEPYAYESEYNPKALLTTIYLNGWPVRFTTTSDPVQVKPEIWLAELQTAKPVELKDGDEIALAIPSTVWGGYQSRILRLALSRREPVRGHGVTGRTFSVKPGTPQRVRLVLRPEIVGKGRDGGEHSAKILVANPLPYAIDAVLDWKLADYYGAAVAEKSEKIHLEPHKTKTIAYPFKANGDACGYQLDVRSRPAEDFSFPVKRPIDMLELSDYSRMEFLPNQPDPLTVWNHTRMDLKDDKTGDRKAWSLDGPRWECAWLEGRRVPKNVPKDLVFKPGKRPKKPANGGHRFGKWLRKKFKVPAWLRGEKYLIEIGETASEATIFLNGKRIGYRKGQRLPLVADASSALRLDGENELVICLRGIVALVKEDYVDKYDPDEHLAAKDQLDHAGSYRMSTRLEEVSLLAVPGVRVTQTLVLPDVEKKTLKIMARIENLDDKTREVEVEFAIFQKGEKVPLNIPELKISLKAGEKKEIVSNADLNEGFFSSVWDSVFGDGGKRNLVPYTPKNPVLAKFVATIAERGKTIDVFEQRFGYRTVKVEGTNLTLNGKNIKLLGSCANSIPNVLEGENSIKVERRWRARSPSWNSKNMHIYDEIGLFSYPHNGIHGCHYWNLLKNDHFWETMGDFQVELVWRFGNHPAAAAWHLCNESHYGVRQWVGQDGALKGVDRIATSSADEIKKRIWPDFWFIADGDEDLEGRINFHSFHYLNQYKGKFRSMPPGEEKRVAFYPPDGFYFNNRSSSPPRKGEKSLNPYVTGNRWVFGEKAIGNSEDIWFVDEEIGPAAARQVGDLATVSSAWQFQTARGMSHAKMTLEACRDMEMAYFCYLNFMDFYSAITHDVAFSMPEQQIRYYSGSEFDRRLNIHDDEFDPGELDFRWKLLYPNGKSARKGEIKLKTDTSTLRRDRIAFEIPEVAERTKFTLAMELWKNDVKRAYEERVVDVWPKPAKVSVDLRGIFVYDPENAVSPVLREMGYSFKRVAQLGTESLKGAKGLIIGPKAANDATFAAGSIIRQFVENGGRVLLMRQGKDSLNKLGAPFEPRAWFSVGFVRSPEHPVMKGLEDMDFQMWNQDHLIARGAYRKPKAGAYMTLVDSCLSASMEWTPLLEIYLGQGSILASQLPLVKDFEVEPMCAELLKRSLDYFEGPVFRQPNMRLAVLNGASDQTIRRLKEVRADFGMAKKLSGRNPATLLDLAGKTALPAPEKAKAYLEKGGTLIVHRATPGNQAWLSSVLGKPVEIKTQPYACWADRLMLERRDGLVTGINNLDLYWRAPRRGCHPTDYVQVSSAPSKEIGQVDYLLEVNGIDDYFFPGGLLEIPVGEGKLLVDQMNWETQEKDFLCGSPRRVLAMLLTNLGVKCQAPAPELKLPKGVVFKPIDISSIANLGLKDEKAKDGKGWCDWGPEKTLKTFPTGKLRLGGTPYLVPKGDKNAVVLRVNPKWLPHLAEHPDSVAIPLNMKNVAGLLFLHTGGWIKGSDTFGERRVIYGDGTEEIIPLSSANLADWNYGTDKFPEELGTLTRVVWKKKAKGKYQPRVYQTLWPNPHPEKTIKEVSISNRGVSSDRCRFISHLGLTAALLPPAAARRVVAPRDAEKAQALLQTARELVSVGKDREAANKIEEALKANNQDVGSWDVLAAIRSKTDGIAEFEKFHHRWLEAMPECSRAWDVLGDFYVKKGEKRQGLAAFKKALKVKEEGAWNQPQIMGKIKKLEKELN